jgi:hypothetical protein
MWWASGDFDLVDEGLEQGLAGLRGTVGDDVVDRVADLGDLVVLWARPRMEQASRSTR